MKNYFIVGHSSGIGKAISEKLGEHSRVFGTYYKNTTELVSGNVSSHYLNVIGNEQEEKIDLSFLPERVDGLIYCPGSINLKPFIRATEEDFLNDYKLQVIGAIKVIQACTPMLKKSDCASIVLFSTVAVKMGFNFHSIVSASKGAIEGLTKALAAEFAPKIRVNCIAPSITNTPLANNFLNTDEKVKANKERHPLKKIGEAEDIANLAIYLSGEESRWITGQVIQIDGGMSSVR